VQTEDEWSTLQQQYTATLLTDHHVNNIQQHNTTSNTQHPMTQHPTTQHPTTHNIQQPTMSNNTQHPTIYPTTPNTQHPTTSKTPNIATLLTDHPVIYTIMRQPGAMTHPVQHGAHRFPPLVSMDGGEWRGGAESLMQTEDE